MPCQAGISSSVLSVKVMSALKRQNYYKWFQYHDRLKEQNWYKFCLWRSNLVLITDMIAWDSGSICCDNKMLTKTILLIFFCLQVSNWTNKIKSDYNNIMVEKIQLTWEFEDLGIVEHHKETWARLQKGMRMKTLSPWWEEWRGNALCLLPDLRAPHDLHHWRWRRFEIHLSCWRKL